MNNKKRQILIITIFFVINSVLFSDPKGTGYTINEPSIPWMQPTNGISLALVLLKSTSDGHLKIYIKNTATLTQYLPTCANDPSIQVYYLGANGSYQPLHDYIPHKVRFPLPRSAPHVPYYNAYKPGEIKEMRVDLTAQENDKLKGYHVMCVFARSFDFGSGYQIVKSQPTDVIEMSDPDFSKPY